MSWLPKKCVVVPIDFSDVSFEALETSRDLVDNAKSLHVIHVLPTLNPADPGVIWQTVDDEGRRRHAEGILSERISDAKFAGIDVQVEIGDPGHKIADYSKRLGAELIVIPSHGRTGLSRLLIGSTAERVVRLAHCPVLVLRK